MLMWHCHPPSLSTEMKTLPVGKRTNAAITMRQYSDHVCSHCQDDDMMTVNDRCNGEHGRMADDIEYDTQEKADAVAACIDAQQRERDDSSRVGMLPSRMHSREGGGS